MTQEQANAIEAYANAKVAMALSNQKLQQLFGPVETPAIPETPKIETPPENNAD